MKLYKGGKALPLGSLALGSRNSSKNGWAHTSKGLRRFVGVYCSTLETKSNASAVTKRDLKTLCQGCALMSGNLSDV